MLHGEALPLAGQGRASEAKQWFQRAISIDREHAGAINNLGVLCKARDVVQRLLARKPGDPVATRALQELDSR